MSEPRPWRWGPLLLPAMGLVAGFVLSRPRRRPPPAVPAPEPTPSWQHGEAGAGGLYAVWDAASEDGPVAHHIEFQYAGMRHQAETALDGMWLFLASEVQFFGGLFLIFMVYRYAHAAAIAEASRHAELVLGTINTVILLISSAVLAYGSVCAEHGAHRGLFRSLVATAALGTSFLLLKGWEWHEDFSEHLFPGPDFAITGPDSGPAQLFWSFYFVATGLHGLHMIVGIGLLAWVAWHARQGRFSPGYSTPVEVVGLYWSFVDMVWLVLYPTIYLAGA